MKTNPNQQVLNDIDPSRYNSLGVSPEDVPFFDAETIKELEDRLSMTPQQKDERMSSLFDAAITKAESREGK